MLLISLGGALVITIQNFFYPSLSLPKPEKRNRFDEKGNYSYPNLGAPLQAEATTTAMQFYNFYQKIKIFIKRTALHWFYTNRHYIKIRYKLLQK